MKSHFNWILTGFKHFLFTASYLASLAEFM